MVNDLQHCHYTANRNNKGQNEHNMAYILGCVLLLKFEGPVVHCLEMYHFPQDSAVCGQASKNHNKAFSLARYFPMFRT